jgi:hypothetical protein
MASRAIQLAGIVAAGAIVGLLVTRPWHGDGRREASSEEPVTSAPTAAPLATPVEPPKESASPGSLPPRTFKLPTMNVASVPAARVKEAKPVEVVPLKLPKDWLVRGTGPEHYLVSSDKSEVMSGQSSVLIAAHDKDVARTTFASLMQSVVAEPWLGKRVVFTINLKSNTFRDEIVLWVRALDAGNIVISYNEWGAQYSKADWQKQSVAIDVPWSATEIAYGVNVYASSRFWIDGAQFDAVERNVDVNARNIPGNLGVTAQDASDRGPLALPSNLDFEIIVDANGNLLEAPKDKLGRKKF